MKIVITCKTFTFEPIVKEADFIPRIGEKVDMFYHPAPTVVEVICWPHLPNHERCDALVIVE